MLKRSADRKVATSVSNAKTPAAKSKNSFGLPSGNDYSCPGATSVCSKICYAGKLEKIYKGVLNVLMHNWALLRDADYDETVALLRSMLLEYRAEADKRGDDKLFRIHWDGDFFSIDYARAWATVCREFNDIQFWVYTRSFVPALNVVPQIAGIQNLSVYLSVDDDNMQYAAAVLLDYPSVRVATLAKTSAEARSMLPDVTPMVCPENIGKLPLVVKRDTGNIGACVACGLCVNARKSVAFSISGK